VTPLAPQDRFAAARSVADATLYEGYVLYPYRASSAKNRVRWQFGVLAPPAVAGADASERSSCRTECLLVTDTAGEAKVSVRVRFLQVQHRAVEAWRDGRYVPVERLESDGQVHVEWDEAVERTVELAGLAVCDLAGAGVEQPVEFCADEDTETLSGGRVVRRRQALQAVVRVTALQSGPALKVTVEVDNTTSWAPTAGFTRDEMTRHAMVALHVMLAAEGGRFVSCIDPPPPLVGPARSCDNVGLFPVLIGSDDVVLASPIILYDHPEVAPESPGDLYDSTEIDEILALRVVTLTEEEKAEARATDPRSAAVVDRCDAMEPEAWSRLHGAVRSLRPAGAEPWWDPGVDVEVDPMSDTVVVAGEEIGRGSRVTLRPCRRADAHDLFISGLGATVAGVFRDAEGDVHVAVSLDDDPATEELRWQGRYLYFHPEEVVPR
jgi:hypothetical protein